MDANNDRIKLLIIKYLKDSLEDEEKEELDKWVNTSNETRKLFLELTDPGSLRSNLREFHESKIAIWEKINRSIPLEPPVQVLPSVIEPAQEDSLLIPMNNTSRRRSRIWLYAAASIPLMVIGGMYLYHNTRPVTQANSQNNIPYSDIAPGKDQAILQLNDGRRIQLGSAGNGKLARQGNAEVLKLSNGELSYTIQPQSEKISGKQSQSAPGQEVSSNLSYNSLSTPRAGQFRITLPDGTKVWLNNASTLRYPTTFEGRERIVELSGEAYFEVAQLRSRSVNTGSAGNNMPFKVLVSPLSGGAAVLVEVLGTHFNIMAYNDEEAIKTTLLEGKVRVTRAEKQMVMRPGEQLSIETNRQWAITEGVDADDIIAWTNGFFHFDHADLQTVMRQLARWYDITVTYEGKIPIQFYHGEIKRDLTLSQVLENLGGKDIHFRIEGSHIVITQ